MTGTRFPSGTRRGTKQPTHHRRLTGMDAPTRQIAFAVLRTGLMVGLAMLLILGLLPAVLAVQAASM